MTSSEAVQLSATLSLLPDGMHVTTAMVAAYLEVGVEAIKSLVKDHRAELEAAPWHSIPAAPSSTSPCCSATAKSLSPNSAASSP